MNVLYCKRELFSEGNRGYSLRVGFLFLFFVLGVFCGLVDIYLFFYGIIFMCFFFSEDENFEFFIITLLL